MALQMIIGGSGMGKSQFFYQDLIENSIKHPDWNYIVIVPEQYTMQTQKNIISLHPRHGFMNIDIISFNRLAYKVLEEQCVNQTEILDDTGKRMVIRRILETESGKLTTFAGSVRKVGLSGELKSAISELIQYDISVEELSACLDRMEGHTVLKGKLTDLTLIYRDFMNFLEGHVKTAEELLFFLCPYLESSPMVRESYIYLDNFTGFTPAQIRVLEGLLKYSRGVMVTLCIDVTEAPYERRNEYELFALTKETLARLEKLCLKMGCERKEDVLLTGKTSSRFGCRQDLAHLERSLYRRKATAYPQEPEHVKLFRARKPATEALCVSREIRRLVRDCGYRYREIAVVCGDVEGYRPQIEHAFAQMEIPCFLDVKRSILENAFIECIRALLDIFSENFSYESVFRYLRSGFTPLSREEVDILENYCLAFGIRGRSGWENPWEYTYEQMDPGMLPEINRLRTTVFEGLAPLYEAWNDPATTVGERTACLRDWIKQNAMQEKLERMKDQFEKSGDLAKANEYGQIYDVTMDLLMKLENILGEEQVSKEEYAQILDAGLSEEKIGLIPPGIDEVIVGDVKRSRLDDVRVLFFMGLNEGLVPSALKGGGLLGDRDKEILKQMGIELAPSEKRNLYYEQFYIYATLAKASDFLYLSYSQVDSDGQALRPSTLLGRIRRIFPRLSVKEWGKPESWEEMLCSKKDAFSFVIDGLSSGKESYPEGTWEELYSFFASDLEKREQLKELIDVRYLPYTSSTLSKAAVRALYGKELRNSISTLESYAQCPYRHFLDHGLHLRERQENRVESLDVGVILHGALEKFARRLKEKGYEWQTVPEDVREELCRECTQEAARENGGDFLFRGKRGEYQMRRLTQNVSRTTWAVQKQLAGGEFYPALIELRFDSERLTDMTDLDLGADGRMKLTGKIDRIDLCEKEQNVYVKVVDYKSGSKEFKIADLYYGLSLQLVMYLNVARAYEEKEHPGKKVIPAGILYYHIEDPMVEWPEPSEKTEMHAENRKEKDIDEGIRKDPSLEQMADGKTRKAVHQEQEAAGEEEILKELKPTGLILDDEEVRVLLDQEKQAKRGSPVVKANPVTQEEFDAFGQYAAHKVREFGTQILDGNIKIHPVDKQALDASKGYAQACAGCLYRSVCGFDERLAGFSYQRLPKLSEEEAKEAIERENEEYAGKRERIESQKEVHNRKQNAVWDARDGKIEDGDPDEDAGRQERRQRS